MIIKQAFLAIIAAVSIAANASAANREALNNLYQLRGAKAAESLDVPQVSAGQITTVAGLEKTQPAQSIALSDFQGYTFMQFMAAPNGMKSALDKDALEPFKFLDKDSINKAADNFDPIVYNKIVKSLVGGRKGLDTLVDSLNGTVATPLTAARAIAGRLEELNLAADPGRLGLTAVSIAPFLSLTSGGGVSVVLDDKNSFLNIGYKSGNDPAQIEKDVKSGRSFGVSPVRKALDVSDKYYLQELDDYLASLGDPSAFYQAIFNIILRCDSYSISGLSPPGQTVVTDFTAVYTAELDRYAMTNFKKHPWQNDLAEATLVSAYSSTEHMVVVDGQFIKGTPLSFFGVGVQGSGIGIKRKDRQILQLAVTNLERKLHPELVNELENLIGRRGGDVIHNLMVFLNTPKNQTRIQANAGAILKAVVNFLSQVHIDALAITNDVKSNGLPKAESES